MRADIGADGLHCRRFFVMLALVAAVLQPSVIDRASAGSAAMTQMKSEEWRMAAAAVHLPVEGELPAFGKAGVWLNSKTLTPADLRGRVVLIEFWTYTCINWRRQLPYVRAWAEKYRSQGLVVIGVHTPEFPFEKDLDNVRSATKGMRVEYPVVTDNDFATWRAFNNEYWPALYFVDAKGRIRHHQFGEGEYQESEKILQQLLAEAGNQGVGSEVVSVTPTGFEAVADWNDLRSGENYVGYVRTENFASPGGARHDKRQDYAAPEQLRLNHWALSGKWTMMPDRIISNDPNGRIAYRFHARDLHLVMGTATPGSALRFRVRIDGKPPGASHGVDVDEQGDGMLTEPRMYQLIRQVKPIGDRQLEIEFLDPGVEAFSFTFG